ncbi:putative hydrolase [Candidatus Vecturithrix granuli]|uniref:Putative hydrolase n=1 Tax=Vecturithrix granuli TaxID=1499967 RepID=A0A081C773_VECG1|nr:putative hydrolase [Candidatus Vecturithrix granuli]
MFRKILRWIAIGLIALVVLVAAAYFWDIHRAYERISGKSTVIPSSYGDIEYTEGGAGPAVLVIHGSGGGYDQGELLVQAVLGEHFHWIAPSRFGYLRSTFHEGATFDDQAHAYAYLLDQLGFKHVAVVALSHGGPSALLFAVLHPERVSSLTLISCGVASSVTQDQAQANQKGDMLTTIYSYNPLYWAISKLFKRQFMELMGANDAIIAGLTPEQRELIDKIIDDMNPVSPRSAGVAFDNKAKMPNERIAAIQAPTLIFHATDDTLQIFYNAEFAASTIPGAKLVRFERGGHLLMSVEQATIRTVMQKHILDHLSEEFPQSL